MAGLIGTTLKERYFLRELVGSGGMADVYIAWDNLRSARMAVKVLRRDLANNPRFFRMFRNEAELLRKLEHPSIVRLYEFEKEGDIAFIVMDWIDGTNVRQALNERKKPLSTEEVDYILEPVCSALNYAHQNKVFHCDVKPANILLHADGRVYLTDFGVARLSTESVGGGTPPYMAPELFSNGEITARTDIYALGITLYEMLSGGKVPYRGESSSSMGTTTRERIAWEHLNLPLPSLRSLNMELPEAVENVVATSLSKNPSDRFSSTMELREAYRHACEESGREGGSSPRTIVQLISPILQKAINQGLTTPPIKPPNTPARSKPVQKPTKRELPSVPAASGPQLSYKPHGPYLLGRAGELSGRTIMIPDQGLSIGRSGNNHLRLGEASISRNHATILRTRRAIYIRDENSRLGTYVNNARIPPGSPVLLKKGDVIQIGYYQVFEFRER